MRAKLAAGLAVVAAVGYLALSVLRALQFGAEPGVGLAFAAAIFAVVAVTAWLIWREVDFGRQLGRMSANYPGDVSLPADEFGRAEVEAAAAEFELAKTELEAAPADWRSWFRVGLAYDANRDRKRARAAMRQAAKLFNSEAN